ncbi:unnamed protein product [Schistosoma turkestanicum]|nr:unnamed protein product [Schistosoma turkestanicum]
MYNIIPFIQLHSISVFDISAIKHTENIIPLKEHNFNSTDNNVTNINSTTQPNETNNQFTSETQENQHFEFQYSICAKKILDTIKSSKHPLGCSMCELSACLRQHEQIDPELFRSELDKLIDMKIVQYVSNTPPR